MSTQQTGQHGGIRSRAIPANPDDGTSQGRRRRRHKKRRGSTMYLWGVYEYVVYILEPGSEGVQGASDALSETVSVQHGQLLVDTFRPTTVTHNSKALFSQCCSHRR